MKKLYELTEEDLLEEHDLMMGIDRDEHGFYFLDTMTAEEMMIQREDDEQRSRFGEVEADEERRHFGSDSERKYWKDLVASTTAIVRRRSASADPRKLGKNQQADARAQAAK